jgi:hypothetical protein
MPIAKVCTDNVLDAPAGYTAFECPVMVITESMGLFPSGHGPLLFLSVKYYSDWTAGRP